MDTPAVHESRKLRRIGRSAFAGAVAVLAAVPASTLLPIGGTAAAAATTTPATGCVLNSPTGSIKHVISLVFDNVHFTQDIPNVPSDLTQMPNLLNFMEHNGVLLSNEHTPLIAHTADDILTTLTGVYGDKHGQPVANSYGVFNSDGTSSFASSFAYWTDPVATTTTDTSPTMVDQKGTIAPAPWVPFTRAGCDVGAFSTANMEVENSDPDIKAIYGANSPQWKEVLAEESKYGYADLSDANYQGIIVHCAKTATSVCAQNPTLAAPDRLSSEPGGYKGYDALYGNVNVGRVIGGTPVPGQGVKVNDLNGQPLTSYYAGLDTGKTYYGFPGFDVSAAQTLGYVADMQEHGIPITYGYIEDAHDNHATDSAAGPGQTAYVAQLKADDAAFGTFFTRLQHDGITPANTLFIISSDEGDHFAGTRASGTGRVRRSHDPVRVRAGHHRRGGRQSDRPPQGAISNRDHGVLGARRQRSEHIREREPAGRRRGRTAAGAGHGWVARPGSLGQQRYRCHRSAHPLHGGSGGGDHPAHEDRRSQPSANLHRFRESGFLRQHRAVDMHRADRLRDRDE